MRGLLIFLVTIVGFFIAILSTIGIPLPSLHKNIKCGTQVININILSELRISQFNLVVQSKISTSDKSELLTCATENFKQYVNHRKLRDHKIEQIEIIGVNSLLIKGGVRAYQHRDLHKWISVSARPNISINGGAVNLDYTYNLHGVPGWAEPDPKPVHFSGDQLKEMIPCIDIVDLELQIGTEYEGFVTFAPRPIACTKWWWSQRQARAE